MKITKIEVQNFKAFKETQLFEIKGNNVLVFGNNGSGKSSFYFALHAFVQSSIKTDAQCAKYFLFDGAESLLNIHAAAGFPSYIRVSTDNGNTYEFSPTLKEGNLTNKDAVIKLANESSDFMNYRLLNAFSNFRNSQDADLFPVFQNEFFPYWTYGTQSYQEWYEELVAEIEQLKTNYNLATKGQKISFWGENAAYGKYLKKVEKFNEEFQTKYRTFIEGINDLMKDIFLKEDKIKLLFDDNSYSPLKVVDKTKFNDCWRLELPKLVMKITKDGKPIPKPHVFLNEARITGIALSIRFAVFAQRYKGEAEAAEDFKLLVLDDLLLSLDMGKRMEVVNYILNNEDFKKYQLFILTHDKGFYSILRNNLIKVEDEWKCFEFYENSNPTPYKNPIVIESVDALKKAEDLLVGKPDADPPIPPKYDECALYLRKKAEELIRIFYDPSLENLSRFEVLEKLSNSLKGVEKEYYGKVKTLFTSLFESDSFLTEDNIGRLKADVYVNDGLARADVLATNNLKFKVLSVLEEFVKYKGKINTVRTDLLAKCKGIDELRDRILNHGAHPTAEPLFAGELAAAVDTVEIFEAELKVIIEWFKVLEKDVLKLKESKPAAI